MGHRMRTAQGRSISQARRTVTHMAFPHPDHCLEFTSLWKYISEWQNVFRHFDRDHSGSIEGRELSEALQSFGYRLSPALLTLIELKYGKSALFHVDCKKILISFILASEPSSGYGPPPGITFDRFVRACVVVKTLTEAFQRYASLAH
jgi:peflin